MLDTWPLRLYRKSVLKQAKFRALVGALGPTEGLRCLDIGADNGVISLLLRQRGGAWKSADLNAETVASIKEMVDTEVYQIDGEHTPFADDEFDRVVIVDFLEHIPRDRAFVEEVFRVLKPGGVLVVNVPHARPSLLRAFRHRIGQTDEKHGHLRPGYTRESLAALLGSDFTQESVRTYSKFFSELVDTLVAFGISLVKRGGSESGSKGVVVTGRDLGANRALFRAYSWIHPLVWLLSKLDTLLFFAGGYMLIARARSLKPPSAAESIGATRRETAAAARGERSD